MDMNFWYSAIPIAIPAALAICLIWGLFLSPSARREARGKKMIEKAKGVGPLVVTNHEKGVMACCRYSDFVIELTHWFERAYQEKEPRKSAELSVTKVHVFVEPTFTFSEEEDRLLVYTGNKSDAEGIANALLEKVTGCRKSQVSNKCWDEAMSHLVIRDSRLIVPFQKDNLFGMNMQAQINTFGNIRWQVAQDEIVGSWNDPSDYLLGESQL